VTSSAEVRVADPGSEEAERNASVAIGDTLLDAAMAAGADISATCGRRGRCRSCRVKIISGDTPPPTLQDRVQLGHEEVQEQFRLACQTRVIGPCHIMVAPPRTETGHQILAGTSDAHLSDLDISSGVEKFFIEAKAPEDEHKQTTDAQEILDKLPSKTEPHGATRTWGGLDVLRRLPSVLRIEGGRLTVTTFGNRIIHIEPGDTSQHLYGMAFDIGTTSIVGSLMDLDTGAELASVGGINPQAVYGAASLVQFTAGQLEITPSTLDRVPQMVFIGRDLDRAGLAASFAFAGAAPESGMP